MGLPSGFIPQEDQGMIYAVIETPPGATIERTNKVAHQLASIIAREDGIESVSSLAGYEILSEGTSANSGSCLINLKPWKERSRTAKEIINDLENKCQQITDANIESSNHLLFQAMVRRQVSSFDSLIRLEVTTIMLWKRSARASFQLLISVQR